jgi:hypothetical protein
MFAESTVRTFVLMSMTFLFDDMLFVIVTDRTFLFRGGRCDEPHIIHIWNSVTSYRVLPCRFFGLSDYKLNGACPR